MHVFAAASTPNSRTLLGRHTHRPTLPTADVKFLSGRRNLKLEASSFKHKGFLMQRPPQHSGTRCKADRIENSPAADDKSVDADQLSASKQAIASAFSEYKKSFPQVEDISPTELQTLLRSGRRCTLVDVREADEQQVSMLEGAVPMSDFERNISEQDKDDMIVTYCTAGLRSGKYARGLQQKGFQVRNLRGSLVSWAHEGGELRGPDGAPVKCFHAYGPQWADMALGSGYETVVHRFPVLKGAGDMVKNLWPL